MVSCFLEIESTNFIESFVPQCDGVLSGNEGGCGLGWEVQVSYDLCIPLYRFVYTDMCSVYVNVLCVCKCIFCLLQVHRVNARTNGKLLVILKKVVPGSDDLQIHE